jgi:hypothetical protein
MNDCQELRLPGLQGFAIATIIGNDGKRLFFF